MPPLHVCVVVCVCLCVCVWGGSEGESFCKRVCTCMCECLRVYVCICARVCVCACVYLWLCVCVHVCACTCVSECMREHLQAFLFLKAACVYGHMLVCLLLLCECIFPVFCVLVIACMRVLVVCIGQLLIIFACVVNSTADCIHSLQHSILFLKWASCLTARQA